MNTAQEPTQINLIGKVLQASVGPFRIGNEKLCEQNAADYQNPEGR